jgi:hypothetical protein
MENRESEDGENDKRAQAECSDAGAAQEFAASSGDSSRLRNAGGQAIDAP